MSSIHFFKEKEMNYAFEKKKINFRKIKLDYDALIDRDNGLESILILNLTDQDIILSMDGKKDYIIVPYSSECIIPNYKNNKHLKTDHIYVKSFYLPENGCIFVESIYKFEFIKIHTSSTKSSINIDKNFFKEKRNTVC